MVLIQRHHRPGSHRAWARVIAPNVANSLSLMGPSQLHMWRRPARKSTQVGYASIVPARKLSRWSCRCDGAYWRWAITKRGCTFVYDF